MIKRHIGWYSGAALVGALVSLLGVIAFRSPAPATATTPPQVYSGYHDFESMQTRTLGSEGIEHFYLKVPTAGTYVVNAKLWVDSLATADNLVTVYCQLVVGPNFDESQAAVLGSQREVMALQLTAYLASPGKVLMYCSVGSSLYMTTVNLRMVKMTAIRVDGAVDGPLESQAT